MLATTLAGIAPWSLVGIGNDLERQSSTAFESTDSSATGTRMTWAELSGGTERRN